jgi:phage terminase large subunit
VWVEDEYYYDSKIHQRQKTDTEYADDLQKFIEGKPIRAIYIDPSAVSFRIELQKQGVTNLYEAENEVIDGIRFVNAMLNNGTLKICANCKNFIKEMQSYVWDAKCQKTGIDKPLKQNDHLMDSCRYALFTHLFNKPIDGGRGAKEIDYDYRRAMGWSPEMPGFFNIPL